MFLIHNTLGEDAKIFSIDETPTPSELFKRVNTNPEDEEDESTLTRVRRLFFEIQSAHPEIVERLKQFPARVKTAKAFSSNQLGVFRRKGLGLFIQSVDDTTQETPEVHSLLFVDALPLIECPVNEPRLSLGTHFWPAYEAIKAYREVLRIPKSENSLEVKAQNNLQSALQFYKDELEPYLPFIRTLVLDLREYKTLPKFTLRRLASVDLNKDDPKVTKKLQKRIGIRTNLPG